METIQIGKGTTQHCIKLLQKKINGMEWLLEKKPDGIKDKDAFDSLKKEYETALGELQTQAIEVFA